MPIARSTPRHSPRALSACPPPLESLGYAPLAILPPSFSKAPSPGGAFQRLRQLARIRWRNEQPGFAIDDDLHDTTRRTGDDRHAEVHRLQQDDEARS